MKVQIKQETKAVFEDNYYYLDNLHINKQHSQLENPHGNNNNSESESYVNSDLLDKRNLYSKLKRQSDLTVVNGAGRRFTDS